MFRVLIASLLVVGVTACSAENNKPATPEASAKVEQCKMDKKGKCMKQCKCKDGYREVVGKDGKVIKKKCKCKKAATKPAAKPAAKPAPEAAPKQ